MGHRKTFVVVRWKWGVGHIRGLEVVLCWRFINHDS